jgi:aldehyde dehydrogenase (NAD+)
MVVLDDAELERAIAAAVFGSYFHQGQICMATNRVIVDTTIHREFVDKFCERVSSLRTGNPADPATQIGPIINSNQGESIIDTINRAESQGAEIPIRGEAGGPTGQVLPPHVVLGTNDVATAREEVFGPVASITVPTTNSTHCRSPTTPNMALSSAVFSHDLERALRLAEQVEAGMTHINDTTVNDEPNTAFGGEKNSGIGRFGGEWAVNEFTTDHWVSVQHSPRTYAI